MPTPTSDPRITLPEQPTVLDVAVGTGADGQILEGGQRVGPYRIERLLGMGGMGAVYLAEQLEPIQRPVALKLIRGQLRGGLAEAYFLVERQALARMDHPAIAKVYDAGTTPQGHLFFAMEWIDGESLTAYCENHQLGLRDRLYLFMRVCMGVQHAHQKGVIHRDLKPGNILVTEIDGRAMPKIIDFGVATGTGTGQSAHSVGQSVGTRGYMSPEQLRGKPGEVDIRSDVFALGVILFELLASRESIALATTAGLDNDALHAALLASVGRKADADAAVVRSLCTIAEPLRLLIARAIDPSRSHRYESAQALADDVDRFVRNYPLQAVPPTRGYKLRCFTTRNRGAILAGAVVAVALVAGTTAAVIGMVRAREAAARANVEATKAKETTQFLVDVLAGVDPKQARDLDKTLLHLLLDRAAARATHELAGQPDVRADIEDAISQSYHSLGEYKTELEHARRAYDAARASAKPDPLLVLQLQRQVGRATGYVGDYHAADAMLRDNLKALTRLRGASDPDTLLTVIDLSTITENLGDLEAAEKQLVAVLPTIERTTGRENKLQIDALVQQANLLTWLGRYREAEPIFRDVIARENHALGPDDAKTMDTMNDFAILYLESKRFAEGERILEKLLPVVERVYGPNHGVTINVVSNLGGALRQQGTPEKIRASGPYYKRAYEAVQKLYGANHINTIISMGNYGNYMRDVGDVDGAIALEKAALARSIATLGNDHEVTGETEYELAQALFAGKRYDEAEPHFLAAIAEKQKDLGAKHWRIGEYMDALIANYRSAGKADKASEWQLKRAGLQPKPASES